MGISESDAIFDHCTHKQFWEVFGVGGGRYSPSARFYILSYINLLFKHLTLYVYKSSCFYVVQACAAYCFITVPSLDGVFTRLNLYLLSGEVALLNQCLSQGK